MVTPLPPPSGPNVLTVVVPGPEMFCTLPQLINAAWAVPENSSPDTTTQTTLLLNVIGSTLIVGLPKRNKKQIEKARECERTSFRLSLLSRCSNHSRKSGHYPRRSNHLTLKLLIGYSAIAVTAMGIAKTDIQRLETIEIPKEKSQHDS